MKKRYTALIVAVSLFVGALVVVGWQLAFISYGDSRFNRGYNDGLVQGRRQVVDAILINVANGGDVVIRQGEQSLTLVREVSE